MIVSTAIQNISAKVLTDSFVDINLHTCFTLYLADWTKNIYSDIKAVETAYFHNHEGYYYNVMPYVWTNTTVIKWNEVVSISYHFVTDTPDGKSPSTNQNVLSLVHFIDLDQIIKIKISHMVTIKHPEVIKGGQGLISTDMPDTEDSSKDGSNDDCDEFLDEEDKSGLGEAGVVAGVTEAGRKEVEGVHQAVKYVYILSYTFKPP